MATLIIRNLSDETMKKLREIAAEHERSVEEEARYILINAVHQAAQKGVGTLIVQQFAAVGGVELELPARSLPGAKQ